MIDWNAADWGGNVHDTGTGSHLDAEDRNAPTGSVKP